MMPKLSQVLGVERKTRTRVQREVTDLYREVCHGDNFAGFNRTYRPMDDEGELFPPESKLVQMKVDDVLTALRALETELFDSVATKEWGNTHARADLVVDGDVILDAVPVTYLLFLEKRLDDLHTFLQHMPTLDTNETWEQDRGDGLHRSEPLETFKMRKVPRNHVKAEATQHHPAQVETYHEDVAVGVWTRVLRSGAASPARVQDLCRRVVKLRDAVISARELANTVEVEPMQVGSKIFEYVLGAPLAHR
jgi:hypothetical protein